MIKKNSTMYSVVGSLGAHVLLTLGAGSFLLNINDIVVPPKTYKLEFVKRKTPPPVKKKKIQKEVIRKEIKVAMLKPKAVPVMQPKTTVRKTIEARPVPNSAPKPVQVQKVPVVQSAAIRKTSKALPVVHVPNSAPKQVQTQNVPVVQSAVIHSSPPTVARRAVTNTPMARSILPVTHSQSTATRTTVHNATARAVRSLPSALKSSTPANTTLGTGSVKMAMVQGTRHTTSPSLPKRVARSFSASPSKGTRGRAALIQRSASMARVPKAAPKVIGNSGNSGPSGNQRVAMIQRGTSMAQVPKAAPRAIGNSGNDGPQGNQRVTPRITGIQLASLTFPNPRGVPNIIDRGALKGYIGRVKRSIEGAKRYPEASRKAGREGKLKVQFTILKNGEVADIKLLTRSPYENLNREAMAAVKRAAPFSGFPESLLEKSLKVILPFKFELN